MQPKLTQTQQRFFSYLEREITRAGKAPSLRQAAAHMGVSHAAISQLINALEKKLAFRGKTLADVRGVFKAKEKRYEKLWDIRLSAQMVSLPEYERVYRSVRRAFRQAGL